MNDESEITNEAPSFEVVPAESVADSSKTSEKSVENLPSDKSLKSETKPSEIKEIKSEIKETKVETKPSEIKEIKEETKVIENTVTETPPTTQNMETVSKPSTIDANVDSNKANLNSEVKVQNKKSDKYNSKVKELTNIMKK
jgi:hypothetical protein